MTQITRNSLVRGSLVCVVSLSFCAPALATDLDVLIQMLTTMTQKLQKMMVHVYIRVMKTQDRYLL